MKIGWSHVQLRRLEDLAADRKDIEATVLSLEQRNMDLLVEEGLLCGVGEQTEDIAQSIEEMQNLDADQVRVMTFVPQKEIPLAQKYSPDSQQELLTIAVLRLVFPERLIPASLDVDGLHVLRQR